MLEDNVLETIVKEMVKKFAEHRNVTKSDIVGAFGGKEKASDEDVEEVIQSLANDAGIIVTDEGPPRPRTKHSSKRMAPHRKTSPTRKNLSRKSLKTMHCSTTFLPMTR